MPVNPPTVPRIAGWLQAAAAAVLLSACGGGDVAAPAAEGVPATHLRTVVARPVFHMAPLVLAEPAAAPADVEDGSDAARPLELPVPAEALRVQTAGLTPDRLAGELQRARIQSAASPQGPVQPMAASARVYTPGQIRAAYGLPALAGAPAQRLGAGQTIYIVIAYHNPTIESDLAAFASRFGLPGCRSESLGGELPLGAASGDGCTFSVAYATADGGMTDEAPARNDQWASESALDVQWAHAMAPMARIVLIEATDASIDALLGAVKLANRMGPGIVSMSWGTDEGDWTASVDDTFTTPGMTYLAATGDDGVNVSWPAVSPRVIAVSGTTLSWSGSGARREVAWSRTGGGVSAYTPVPAVQAGVVVRGRPLARRAVGDVSFNADPYTGQYVAMTSATDGQLRWQSCGGTSISAPQWAGLLAVAGAVRASKGVAANVRYAGILYKRIANDPGAYARAFTDITAGRNGGCPACAAVRGYDIATGWGTPNFAGLMPLLTQDWLPNVPTALPVGSAGRSYAVKVPTSDLINGAYAITIEGAPEGLAVGEDGMLRWDEPVAGRYDLTLRPTADSGATTSAVRTLVILAAPEVPGGELTAVRKRAFKAMLDIATAQTGALTYTLQGAPRGLVIGPKGGLSWPSPVAGTYEITVTARNALGVTASGVYTLVVS